jgi:hypothetical protein
MTFLAWPLISRMPWQAWFVAGVLVSAGAYHLYATNAAYRAGKAAEITKQEKEAANARKGAETELRRLDDGDDSRVRQFDRD